MGEKMSIHTTVKSMVEENVGPDEDIAPVNIQ